MHFQSNLPNTAYQLLVSFFFFFYSIGQYWIFNCVCSFSFLVTFTDIVHPNINILPLSTHPQVVPNLYEFLSSIKKKVGMLVTVAR